MKKIILTFIILILTGCTNYNEMNNLGVITSLGIDYENDLYNITVSLINFNDNNESIILESNGKTIYEAMEKLTQISSKTIYIEHLKVLVLSEEVFSYKLDDIIGYFTNYPDSPINFYTVVSSNAKEIITISSPFDNINGKYIEDVLYQNSDSEGISNLETFDELLNSYVSKKSDPIIPYIKTEDNLIKIDSLVTKNNNNEIIHLTKKESIGYNFIKKNIKKTSLTIPCNKNYFTVELKWINSKIKYKDFLYKFNYNIFGTIQEFNCNIEDSKYLEKYVNQKTKKELENYISSTIDKSIEINSDYLSLGKYIYAYNYKEFNKLNNYLNKIKYEINIDLDINKLGNLKSKIKGSD